MKYVAVAKWPPGCKMVQISSFVDKSCSQNLPQNISNFQRNVRHVLASLGVLKSARCVQVQPIMCQFRLRSSTYAVESVQWVVSGFDQSRPATMKTTRFYMLVMTGKNTRRSYRFLAFD